MPNYRVHRSGDYAASDVIALRAARRCWSLGVSMAASVEYLSLDASRQQLRWGNTIEVPLSWGDQGGTTVIRYCTLASNRDGDGLVLSVWEVEDPRQPDWIDIYSFPEPIDYEALTLTFDSIDDAFSKIQDLGGDLSQAVKQGDLQGWYALKRGST